MGQFEYKVLPTPRRAKRAKGVKGEPARFAHALTDAINAEAHDGWEYYKSETLPMEMKPGFFKSRVETFQSLLIFRREVPTQTPEDISEVVTERIEPVIAPHKTDDKTASKPADRDGDDKVDAADLDDTDAVEQVTFDKNRLDPLKTMVDTHRESKSSD